MTGKRGRPSKQKPLSPPASGDNGYSGKIVPTNSWINVKGKAVYVNIPEADIHIVDSKEYGRRVSFITSLAALKGIASGEKKGAQLGRFED